MDLFSCGASACSLIYCTGPPSLDLPPACPSPPSERGKMPAQTDGQRDDAVDLQCECADIGIPDADAVCGEEGEE